MNISPENIAQHLVVFGYTAKTGTIVDKKSGEAQPVVFINGMGSINAYLNLSDDPTKFGLKVFGNLQEGYAPVVLDDNGDLVKETVIENGKQVIRAKRGTPLDAEALKRKNNEISLAARKEISAAVLAAYMLEAAGGDLEKVRDGFRLQKWERTTLKHAADGGDVAEVESSLTPEINQGSGTTAQAAPASNASQSGKRYKRAQSTMPSM